MWYGKAKGPCYANLQTPFGTPIAVAGIPGPWTPYKRTTAVSLRADAQGPCQQQDVVTSATQACVADASLQVSCNNSECSAMRHYVL